MFTDVLLSTTVIEEGSPASIPAADRVKWLKSLVSYQPFDDLVDFVESTTVSPSYFEVLRLLSILAVDYASRAKRRLANLRALLAVGSLHTPS